MSTAIMMAGTAIALSSVHHSGSGATLSPEGALYALLCVGLGVLAALCVGGTMKWAGFYWDEVLLVSAITFGVVMLAGAFVAILAILVLAL